MQGTTNNSSVTLQSLTGFSSSHLISRLELAQRLLVGDLRIAEALPERYFVSGHLPTAVNMPLDAIEATATREAWAKSDEIVVYCSSDTCQNSHIAARKLIELGYSNVRVFAGGKAEWKEAGLPLEM